METSPEKSLPPADVHASAVRMSEECAATAAMVDDIAPVDDATAPPPAPAKNIAEEKAADRAAGANGLFNTLIVATGKRGEGGGSRAKRL